MGNPDKRSRVSTDLLLLLLFLLVPNCPNALGGALEPVDLVGSRVSRMDERQRLHLPLLDTGSRQLGDWCWVGPLPSYPWDQTNDGQRSRDPNDWLNWLDWGPMNHSSGAWCLLPLDLWWAARPSSRFVRDHFACAALGLAFLGDRDGSVQPRMRGEFTR